MTAVTAVTGQPRCSLTSAAAGESLAGSAPRAVAWVALEQPGPWGPKAFTSSHLDADLGRAVESAATAAGVRPCLVRRPGRHPDPHRPGLPRRVLIAFTVPGRSWLLTGDLEHPRRLLDLDWSAVAAGRADDVRRSLPEVASSVEPELLVCTNGTRDTCCALFGRPVVAAAAAVDPGRVWEVTHTSGHRFAPTSVLLPSGVLHGRLNGPAAVAVLEAADRGELQLAGCRGRSTWSPEGQVAELAVREAIGERGLDALSVAARGPGWEVRHHDGRTWTVTVAVRALGAGGPGGAGTGGDGGVLRPESCGKPAVPVMSYVVQRLVPGR